jgi:hypothetical protein
MKNKILRVFDLDDTLLITPTFSELIPKDKNNILSLDSEYSGFLEKIREFFFLVFVKEIYFVASGHYIVVFNNSTKSPLGVEYISYIQDLDKDKMLSTYGLKAGSVKDVLRALEIKDNKLVFRAIPGFHENPETIGKFGNSNVAEVYNKSENRMILTGRNMKLKPKIEERLIELGMQLPNYGLFCFPGGKFSIQEYKVKTILDAIIEDGWSEVHFYEDKKDWLYAAKEAVNNAFPEVVFYPHLITIEKHM